MTNIKSFAGASVWMFVSTLLFFAALEPVSTGGTERGTSTAIVQA